MTDKSLGDITLVEPIEDRGCSVCGARPGPFPCTDFEGEPMTLWHLARSEAATGGKLERPAKRYTQQLVVMTTDSVAARVRRLKRDYGVSQAAALRSIIEIGLAEVEVAYARARTSSPE